MQDPLQTPILGYPLLPDSAEQRKWKLGKLQTGMSAELLWIWWGCCNSWRSTIQTRSSKAVAPNHIPTHPFQVWVFTNELMTWIRYVWTETCKMCSVGCAPGMWLGITAIYNYGAVVKQLHHQFAHQAHIYMFHRAKCHLKNQNTIVNILFLDPSTLW